MTARGFAATMGAVMRRIAVLGSLALCSPTLACASHEPPTTTAKEAPAKADPEPEPEPEAPPPEPIARAAIASVQMIEDCPNQNDGWRPPPVASGPAQAPAAAAAAPADEPAPAPMPPVASERAARAVAAGSAIGGGGGWVQPCTQSTMQLSFTGQGDRSSTVEIEKVRLLDPKTGKVVARVQAREPAAWTDGAYQSWNETIGPRQEVKASYELSVPDWYEVEKQIGTGSDGFMFVLEVDVKVGDELQTVHSAQFPREAPHVIVT
jgi:hypothetical protein